MVLVATDLGLRPSKKLQLIAEMKFAKKLKIISGIIGFFINKIFEWSPVKDATTGDHSLY